MTPRADEPGDASPPAPRRPRTAAPDPAAPAPSTLRRRLRATAALAGLLALGSTPWWGPKALAQLAFFRVRRVEIVGARYLPEEDVARRLAVDTTVSVWTDLEPLERRVEADSLVLEATVARRLPGTLVVTITEKEPIALVAARGGFRTYDRRGALLPIEPSKAMVDLPLLAGRDTALLRLLGEVRDSAPAIYARLSEVRRAGRRELVLRLADVPVRAMADVRAARLADIIPVEQDLARRRARVVELDLRYREQVVARLE